MGEQIKIDFDGVERKEKAKKLFEEKSRVALEYNIILHEGDFVEKDMHLVDNIWYVGDETLKIYADRQDELYKNDKDTPWFDK